MIWITKIIGIYLKEQFQIKYYMIKHLILLKIRKYTGHQLGLAAIAYKFFDKNFLMKLGKISN